MTASRWKTPSCVLAMLWAAFVVPGEYSVYAQQDASGQSSPEKLLSGPHWKAWWPAEYGTSGIKTFIVNQDGVVLDKDLGDKTTEIAKAMIAYDPDPTWHTAQ